MTIAEATKVHKTRSTIGLRAAVTILENWGATEKQGTVVLNVSRRTYNRAKRTDQGWEANLGPDQVERISLLLNIHAALRAVFDNPANVYGFMTMVNNDAWFNGRTPLDTLTQGGFGGFYETFKRIDALRGAQW